MHATTARDDWTLQEHLGPNHALYTHKADGRTVHLFYKSTRRCKATAFTDKRCKTNRQRRAVR